ncbi:unnamed protein product, partial [marine sediment metagenome]
SGGLLISLAPDAAGLLIDKLKEADIQNTAIIGEVVAKPPAGVLIEE